MKKTPGRGKAIDGQGAIPVEHDHERWQRTAVAAFFRAEARGFVPGMELDDWLAAEQEVASSLTPARTAQAAAPKKPSRPKPDTQPAAVPSPSVAAGTKRATAKRASSSRQSQAGLSTQEGGVA